MMRLTFTLATITALACATPALAAPGREALHSLEVASRMSPDDGGAAIELAAAYQRAGRVADANTAFRRALALDNIMLETPTGDAVWSHQVARQALARDAALASR